jgi:hypothetical protein
MHMYKKMKGLLIRIFFTGYYLSLEYNA